MKQARLIAVAFVIVVAVTMGILVTRPREGEKSGLPTRPATQGPSQPAPEQVAGVVESPLTQLLPAGAVAVVQYRGGEQLKSAYEQSVFGQVFNDPRMQEFLRKPKQRLYRELASQKNAPPAETVEQLHRWLVGKESAIAVYVDVEPSVVACLRLGADAAKARTILQSLFKDVPSCSTRTSGRYQVTVIPEGGEHAIVKDVLVFASDPKKMDAFLEQIDSASSNVEALKPPAFEVGEKILWATVDAPLALKKARAAMEDQASLTKFDTVVRELGIEQVGRIEFAAGFDGVAIRTALRIPGLAADRGFLAFSGGGAAVDDAALRLIPRDAASASAAHVNLTAVWDTVMRIVEATTTKGEFQEFQSGLAKFEAEAQVHLKEDLIDSAGDAVVFYSKLGATPIMPGEMALTLGLKNPQKFAQGIEHLLDYADKQLAANQRPGQGMAMTIQRSKVGETDVRYLGGLPMFSPAYAVSDSHAFLAMSPMSLNAALAQADKPQSSLLDNPDYQNARSKLPPKATMVAYEDTRQVVAILYAMIGTFGPMLAGQPDAPIDLALVPPLASVQDKVFGSVIVGTTDGGEFVTSQYSSLGVTFNSFAGGGTPIMAAMLLPALNQAREKARRANCMSNLKQIGLACYMYADKHDDRFPAKLDELSVEYLATSKVFHCPSAPGETETSYVYVGGLTPKDADKILAYDADMNHRGQGRNVLFVDGHVQWMTEVGFQGQLRQQLR